MCLDGYAGVDAATALDRMWVEPGEGIGCKCPHDRVVEKLA